MVDKKILADTAHKNIIAFCEIRDSSIHFYNKNNLFAIRLQEVGSASIKNYAKAATLWFNFDFSIYNFYLMPLAFVQVDRYSEILVFSKEEQNLASFISTLEAANDSESDYAVSVNVELKFSKSKVDDAIKVQLTNDPGAKKVHLTEEQVKDRFPINYDSLTAECRARYSDFLVNSKYHELRNSLKTDKRYCFVKKLDPDNPRSAKQEWFSRAIFNVFDREYSLKV